jgi:hypothetical protein
MVGSALSAAVLSVCKVKNIVLFLPQSRPLAARMEPNKEEEEEEKRRRRRGD